VGTGILFIGFEGFGLVTNAAGDMKNPGRMVPRALYLSVLLATLIYIGVAVVVSGNLTTAQIAATRDYALAAAAKPFLGEFGFKLIAVAALFSTASAINATP
jgi:amino acid transporter